MGSNERVELYFHYSAANELLYVGISLSTVARLSQHKTSKWRDEISYVKIVGVFSSRPEAEAAEREAIITLKPKYNVMFAKPRPTAEELRVERDAVKKQNDIDQRNRYFEKWNESQSTTQKIFAEPCYGLAKIAAHMRTAKDGLFETATYYKKLNSLQREAAFKFGQLNGWVLHESYDYFDFLNIGRRLDRKTRNELIDFRRDTRYEDRDSCEISAFQQRLYFKREGVGAALVTQPHKNDLSHRYKFYDESGRFPRVTEEEIYPELKRWALQYGVECHEPSDPYASIEWPGECRFFVFTYPGHKMIWLPEQTAKLEKAKAA